MQKVEFKLERPSLPTDKSIKAGDVLCIREQPAQSNGQEQDAASGKQQDAQLGCYLLDEEHCLGTVPLPAAKTLRSRAARQSVQASVRSVKRDSEGNIQEVLLRVQIDSSGQAAVLAHQAVNGAAAETTTTAKQEYVIDDDGFQLRHIQLQQLLTSSDLVHKLADERLQELLVSIDNSADREKALGAALQRPAFKEFADQVLGLLDAGLQMQA